MGRNIGTNVYSNNFEPQVMGLLDARGKAATKADLITAAQWTSTDGNIYAPKAILVAVTDDPIAENNGLYMLKGDDYSVASNWMQINGENVSSNIKVLTTPNLLNPERTSGLYFESEDVTTLKGITSDDLLIYVGQPTNKLNTVHVPLSIERQGGGSQYLYMTVTFLLSNEIYSITINGNPQTNLYAASAPIKKEFSEVEFIDLSQIAAQNDTNVPASESLKTELEKLYDVIASTKIPFANWFDNIEGKYPISIKDDSGTNTTFTVLFNNELWEVDYNRATSTYSTTKVENGQGGGSNIKFLNTPDLFSRDRQTIISLNVNDQDVIKSLYSNNYQQTPIFYVGSMTGDEGIYPISIACSSFTTTIDPYGDVVYLSTINDVGESYKISIDVIDWVASLPKQVPSSSATTSKHDLSIDVKTYSPQGIAPKIYFRIREKVPNGRIHFVRKKRMRYFDRNDNLFRSLGYAVMEADCHHDGGVDVSTLSPNTWYEYPITGVDLISSYPPGSSVNGKKRTHGVIRFKGATYAKSFEFKNAPFTQTQTTLHAGLQYNVLSGKKSPLFKERGEVVPIDVRLIILSTSNYNAGYEYSYVVQ